MNEKKIITTVAFTMEEILGVKDNNTKLLALIVGRFNNAKLSCIMHLEQELKMQICENETVCADTTHSQLCIECAFESHFAHEHYSFCSKNKMEKS